MSDHFMQKPLLGSMIDWANPITRDLVAYYLLNEGMGDIAYDSTLYENNGTFTNFGWTAASGWSPDGVAFTVLDYIDCGNPTILQFSDAVTFAARMKTTSDTVDIFSKYLTTGNQRGTILQLSSSGKGRMAISSDGINATTTITTDPINTGKWVWLVGTYDGSNIQVYLDGYPNGSPSAHTGAIFNSSDNFYIGRSRSGGGFVGEINQVAAWRRAISPKEVLSLWIDPYVIMSIDPYKHIANHKTD